MPHAYIVPKVRQTLLPCDLDHKVGRPITLPNMTMRGSWWVFSSFLQKEAESKKKTDNELGKSEAETAQ
jgi:hypothetical protein